MVKNPPANRRQTLLWSLGREDPLEEGMATHLSILAWRIPWTEEPGRLQSIGLQSQTQLKWLSTQHWQGNPGLEGQRVRQDWSNLASSTDMEAQGLRDQEPVWRKGYFQIKDTGTVAYLHEKKRENLDLYFISYHLKNSSRSILGLNIKFKTKSF